MNLQTEALVKAQVLSEALPWLLKFQNECIVIKFGGNAMIDKNLIKAFAQDLVFLRLAGIQPIVVHGGGPQITSALEQAQIQTQFVKGLRYTPKEAIAVIKDVLINQIQKEIVHAVNEILDCAVGFSGDENELLKAETINIFPSEPIDLGFVGDVTSVNNDSLLAVLADKKIPIISTLGVNELNETLNINADSAAGAIAVSLKAKKIVLLTDVIGLLQNYPDPNTLISQIDSLQLEKILPQIDEGMRPKMQACLDAIAGGVSRAHVIDGRAPHALLVEVFTDKGAGTMVMQ